MNFAIGMDVGGTSLRVALVDESGVIIKSAKRAVETRTPEAILGQLSAMVAELGPTAKDSPITVGFAAQLRVAHGLVAVAPAFGWHDVPFGPMMTEHFGRPVRLVNDLDAITVGEAIRGAGRGTRHLMCVFVGTGVGLGVVSHGQVLEGAEGYATELGHTKVASTETGRKCGCGERGCLEAYTSGSHLPELFLEKTKLGLASPLMKRLNGDVSQVNSLVLEEAATSGDPAAQALWVDIGNRLGLAIGNCITLYNPAVVVLGGGVLRLAPSLRERVVKHARSVAARPHLRSLDIRDTELGDDAGLVGAGLLSHGGDAVALRP